MKIGLASLVTLLLLLTLTSPLFFGSPVEAQPQGFVELLADRTRHSKTFVSQADPGLFQLDTSLAPVHYETSLDSGVFDGELNLTPRRVINGQLDGWLVTDGTWHYALGQPGDKTTDGWVGFGGRQAAHWFEFRLFRFGYLHWPTRTFQDVGGAPTYDRANLVQESRDLTFTHGDPVVVETVANWSALWTTPGGGELYVTWSASGDGLKEEIVVNQAAREWVAANAPPTTPAAETYFGFALQVDWNDVPKVLRGDVEQNLDGDFSDDETIPIELRDAQDRLLALLPISEVFAGNRSGESMPIRKRFYDAPGLSDFLLLGTRVDRMNTLPAGDLIFDPTVDVQVGAGADDTDTETGSWSNSRTSPDCPGRDNSAGSTPCDTSFRWTGVTVPQGAAITAATFEPWTFPSGDDGPNVRTNIYAEDADSPSAPSSLADFNGRTRTSAFTAWDGQSFSDQFTISPDISGVIQEIVDRPGFGSVVQVFWDDDLSPAPDSHYEHRTYNFAPSQGAKLHITFTVAVEKFGVFTDAACDELAISTDADCWAGTSGGAGGVGVPGFGDNVTLDTNTGTFGKMDANLTVANVSWLNHPFDFTTGGFVLQANGSWSQDSGFLNIDGPGGAPGGVVVLGDFTLFDSGFILFDESNGFVRVGGDLLFDDEAYVDVSLAFLNATISVAGNYTALSVDAGNWDSTNLTVVLEGTQAQIINTTTDADLDLLILRNSTKSLVSDFRGIILRADAGVVNLTVENGRTVTLGPSGRIENLTLRSDVFGSLYNVVRSGGSIVTNNTDFQDVDGSPFLIAHTEAGNVDSGNNVNVSFLGVAPLTFLNATWLQDHLDPVDPLRPRYRFFDPQFGETPVPRVQVVADNDPFEVTVTRHDADNVTLEVCTSDPGNDVIFTFDGLIPNRQYRLYWNGAPQIVNMTDGSGTWVGDPLRVDWDECPTDVLSLLGEDFPASVETVSAAVTMENALLRGNLTSLGSPAAANATVFFEWGFSPELGFVTNATEVDATGEFVELVLDLEPGTTYFFRAVAVEGANESRGDILSFTTQSPFWQRPDTIAALVLSALAVLLCIFALKTRQRSIGAICGVVVMLAGIVWVALLTTAIFAALIGTVILAVGLILLLMATLGRRFR